MRPGRKVDKRVADQRFVDGGDVKGLPPAITPETEHFWRNAAAGRLVVDRCTRCGSYWFPPRRFCRECLRGDAIDPGHQLRGPAKLYSFTVNCVPWLPGMQVPYAIGLAEFEEAPGVRVPCRLRAVNLATIRVGAVLDIGFEPGAGVAIPSFEVRPGSP